MLVIDISVNGSHHISSIGAVRISHVDERPDKDDVCTYSVGRIYERKIKRPAGTVEHRYGDSDEVLAVKAIEKVLECGTSSLEEDNLERLMYVYNNIKE